MTAKEAAEKALQAVGRPMHSTEIIDFAVNRGWISPRGKTPEHSLQSVLWRDMQKHGSQSKFRVIGEARRERKYALRKGGKH